MPHFLNLTPLNLPQGETSDLSSNQRQSTTPLPWRGWGRSKFSGKLDGIILLLLLKIKTLINFQKKFNG